MSKITEGNCRIGDSKVMNNTKGAPNKHQYNIYFPNVLIFKHFMDKTKLMEVT